MGTKYLYQFSCKPNYPIIRKAVVIFWSHNAPSNRANVLTEAKEIARNAGIYYVSDDAELKYLGDFWPLRSADNNIILEITGEY